MPRSGPAPKPTRLKLLHGNRGHQKLNRDEPQPVSGLPPCPAHLTGRARDAYEEFAPLLGACGVGTRLDGRALELFADAYATYRENAALVAEHGAVWIEGEKEPGHIPKFAYSPHWAVMNKAWKQVMSMLAEFGATPAARARVKTDAPPQSKLDKYRNA